MISPLPRLEPTAATATGLLARGTRIPALDALRGLAILLVLAYHFNVGPDDPSRLGRVLSRVLHLGGCGVDLFFVLSGFLITGILFDAKGEPRYFRDFYLRRTLRIFPLYYGVLIVAFVLWPLLAPLPKSLNATHQGWLWLYAGNIILAWKGTFLLGGFTHFWSLAVEEHFYLIWPLVIALCDRKRAMTACLACIVGALACRLGIVLTGRGGEIAAYVLTPCRMDALAAGGWLALALRGPIPLARWRRIAAWSALACVVAAGLLFGWKGGLSKMDGSVLILRFTLSSWLFATLVLLAVTAAPGGWTARLWEARWLRGFGKYSYGLYVFHFPLIPAFERLFPAEALARLTGSALLGRLLFMGLATAATFGVALLSWNLFEAPFLRLKEAWTGPGAARGGETPPARAEAAREARAVPA